MSTADLIQAGSLLIVATALVVSAVQVRLLARQNRTLTDSIEKSAFDNLVEAQSQSRVTLFMNDPALLSWYLSSRGFPPDTEEMNNRLLYVMYKLDLHEYNFINHRRGILESEVWNSWQRVIERDFAVYEFRHVWMYAQSWYVRTFSEYINSLIDRLELPPPDVTDP